MAKLAWKKSTDGSVEGDVGGAPAGEPTSLPVGHMPRRRFLGYLIAAPTLVAAARLGGDLLAPQAADASVPGTVEPSEIYDLSDLLTDAAMPTSNLITVVVNADNTVSFDLPRSEVGQGITTAVAMCIADEMNLAVSQVEITLADARPELLFNQLTGASNTMHAIFTPVRVAAALALGQLLAVAADELDANATSLVAKGGVITAPSGQSVTYGQLAAAAAVSTLTPVSVLLKADSAFTVIGTSQPRIDALAAVTGQKVYAMDLVVPGALPTMICRPPTINGTVVSVNNAAQVAKMPGITDVVAIPSGVAVRGATFGQCIDAVDALHVTWGAGTEDNRSDADVLVELQAAELPLLTPIPPLATTIDESFTYYFVSNCPLETNCAIADVTADSAEIWSSLKSPITAQAKIAAELGMAQTQVTCHVVQGGGSFGRHLFYDAALEAAKVSQLLGKPVKLMWARTDDFRQGRTHPMAISHVRASYLAGEVLTFEQVHTSVSTDFSHGLGEAISAEIANLPGGNFLGYSETVFELSQDVPYNFGLTTQTLGEVDMGFNTGSMRNVYSPDATTAIELVVDRMAAGMGTDRYQFRRSFAKDPRMVTVLDEVAQAGKWGRSLSPGVAQGIACHGEYKGCVAALVEIDCRPGTVNRKVPHAYTGPRVTKVVLAVDVGLPINPLGLEAQMQGGIMDGIARALTFSVHLQKGLILEGSWDNAYYTRQWNVPPHIQVIIVPTTTGDPGGAGEFGVAPTMAAVACAYAQATGTMPASFPLNHNQPLGFTPFPAIPPLPESPTNGLHRGH